LTIRTPDEGLIGIGITKITRGVFHLSKNELVEMDMSETSASRRIINNKDEVWYYCKANALTRGK
jgi:hypothetical protein